jgi:hypothetical protein
MTLNRAGANDHRPLSFDQAMKFKYYRCIAALAASQRWLNSLVRSK